ncbi:GNAT family N-acetyltransferase [Sporosarcina luteola]|uniref:GNAT family N-acetyltransferase n=1 Tax=Sporosarcina luteola TaxID=582850 RepID=UPI0020425A4E|nr:GNAT family N-acetyltransferase [Sporosarcina luteola]MCM3639274.1 GNAT family N-acetyltransferase [Sporosarcina luteola]
MEENQNTNPFVEFVWVYEWWKHFGDEYNVEIMLVILDEKPIGFFPFIHKTRWFSHTYTFIAFGLANYMNFVVYEHLLDDVIEFVFDELIKVQKNVVFYLHGLLESDKTSDSLEAYVQKRKSAFSIHRVITPYIHLQEIELEQYSDKRKRLHRIDKREKRLRKNGAVKFLRSNPEEMDSVFHLFEKRWKKRRSTSGFTSDKGKEFFRGLAGIQDGSMQTEIDGLYINDKMIAFQYGFLCRGRFVGYVKGYDDDFHVFGPGIILEKQKTLQCMKNAVTIFDLSIGYEPSKFELNTGEDYTRKMIFSSNSLIGKTVRHFFTLKESLLERMKKNYSFVLFIRNTIGKLLYVSRNVFNTESKTIKEELVAYLTRVKKYLYERKKYIVYKIEKKDIPGLFDSGDFIELTIGDAVTCPSIANSYLKEVCKKIFAGYTGYYPVDCLSIHSIFWMNERVMRIESISYSEELHKKSAFIQHWSIDNIEKICSFVKRNNAVNTLYVSVEARSKYKRAKLEGVGFTISKYVFKRRFLGFVQEISKDFE